MKFGVTSNLLTQICHLNVKVQIIAYAESIFDDGAGSFYLQFICWQKAIKTIKRTRVKNIY